MRGIFSQFFWRSILTSHFHVKVAVVYKSPISFLQSFLIFSTRCVSLEMLKAGFATVYEGSGAHYDPFGKSKLLALEATAKYCISFLDKCVKFNMRYLGSQDEACGRRKPYSKALPSTRDGMLD